MRKLLLACVTAILTLRGIASSAGLPPENLQSSEEETYTSSLPAAKLAYIPWNAANIDKLRAVDEVAIEAFFRLGGSAAENEDFDGFAWVDLAGDGKYELLVKTDTKSWVYLIVYWQQAPGKVKIETYDSGGGDAGGSFKDLSGDGKKELILGAKLDSDPRTISLHEPVAWWPQVYRLENGRYVEASRDFPSYYENEVLPALEKRISEMRQEVAKLQSEPKPTPGGKYGTQKQIDTMWFLPERRLAVEVMERDKILRMLGRDPNAGLAQAREWMKSPDPELVEDAVVVLRDMGEHPQDLAAAEAALRKLDPGEAELQDFIDKQKP